MMRETILARLQEIETVEGVRILYACESGSRAWGFPSADSDYGVRFLYVRPVAWYLSIDHKRDVIERPIEGDLDISGWDLKKALRLFLQSNPPLLEWLSSPIVYREAYAVAGRLRELAGRYYSPDRCLHAYLRMAQQHHPRLATGQETRAKDWLYTLRALLALRWIEEGRGVVPMRFHLLLDELALDPSLKDEIGHLVAAKRGATEHDTLPVPGPIRAFVEQELAHRQAWPFARQGPVPPCDELDDLFRAALQEVWQPAAEAGPQPAP